MPNKSYTITGANGKDYTIKGPEGASKEQLVDILLHYKPEAAKPPERTTGDYLGGAARQALKGIAGTGEFILDSALGEWSPGRGLPMAAEWASDKLGLAKPVTRAEKLAGAAVEVGASGINPASIGRRGLLKAIPVIAGEFASGAGAGAAGEYARQHDVGAIGQIAATLAGGSVGTAGRGLREGSRALGEFVDEGTGRAARRLRQQTHDPEAAIKAIAARERAVPGTSPLTAEVARDPGIAAAHRATISTPALEQQNRNAQAGVERASTLMGPGEAGDVSALADRAAIARQGEVTGATERIGPIAEGENIGSEFRSKFEDEYAAARRKTANEYDHPILDHEFHVPDDVAGKVYTNMKGVADEFYGNAGGDAPRKVQSAVYDILDQLTGKAVSTKTITNVDRRLADFAGEASMRGNKSEAEFAQGIRDAISKDVDPLLPRQYKRQLAKAKAARLEQGQRFEQGRVPRALASKRFGEDAVPDTELAKRLVQSGDAGATTADQMIRAVGPQTSETAVRAQLRRLIDNREVVPANLQKKFGELTKRFPGLQDHVDDLLEKSSALEAFHKSPFGKLAGDMDATTAIHSMIQKGDGSEFKSLIADMKGAGDEKALGGLRRIMADYVEKAGATGQKFDEVGRAIPNTDRAMVAIDTVLKRGSEVLSPEQQKSLFAIRQQMAATNYAGHAGVFAKGEAAKSIPFAGGPQARTLKFAWERFGNNANVNKLIDRAMIDPEFASDLLKRPTGERKARILRTVKRHALGTMNALPQASGTGANLEY